MLGEKLSLSKSVIATQKGIDICKVIMSFSKLLHGNGHRYTSIGIFQKERNRIKQNRT